MMKGFLIVSIALAAVFSGCQKECPVDCIDESLIDPDRLCTMEYDPVCGCNNVTYGNACIASSSGVVAFTKGECE